MSDPQARRGGLRLVPVAARGLDPAVAAHVRQLVLALDLPAGTAADLVRVVERDTRSTNGWTFVMLSPGQNAEVVAWIMDKSKRPLKCARLWSELFVYMRNDTGEILASRAELAEKVGLRGSEVSECMTELETVKAIRRVRDGRRVRYFMNANVATRATGSARDRQQEVDGPLLTIMQGGRVD